MLRVKRMGVWWEHEKEGEGLEQSLPVIKPRQLNNDDHVDRNWSCSRENGEENAKGLLSMLNSGWWQEMHKNKSYG